MSDYFNYYNKIRVKYIVDVSINHFFLMQFILCLCRDSELLNEVLNLIVPVILKSNSGYISFNPNAL
jgi:hypothetical protein